MKNKKFIKFLSIFMMAIMLVSTLSLPVLAAAEGEVEEAPATIWDKILNVITSILAVIAGIILAIVYTIFIVFSFLLNILFIVGETIVNFVISVVNAIAGLF